MSFEIITEDIFVVACFYRFIFAPGSAKDSVFLLGEFGGVPIQFIKLIIGLLSLILIIISPNHHLQSFSLPPSCFLY